MTSPIKYGLLFFCLLWLLNSKAQKPASSISGGMCWYNYSWKGLNNRNNISGKAGQAVYINLYKGLHKSWAFTPTFLLGRINDLSTSTQPYQNTEFAELDLSVHTSLFGTWEEPAVFTPGLCFGYAFQKYFNTEIPQFSQLQTAVFVGADCKIKIKDHLFFNAGISSNQKLISDFRTYLRFNLGAAIKL